MRRPPVLTAVVATLLASPLAACFSDAPAPAEPAPPNAASVQASETANVFSPQTVTIGKGGAVTWTFGTRRHNVTFVQTQGVPENVPNTVSDKATRTFAQPGTFAYVCTLHGGMVGTVVVK
jgi:plastocyanin